MAVLSKVVASPPSPVATLSTKNPNAPVPTALLTRPLGYVMSSQGSSAPGEVPQKPRSEDNTKTTTTTTTVELQPSVERVWRRVLQQGYTIEEAAAELNLRPRTAESYVLKAITSGRSYFWGPHLGISNDILQKVSDATQHGESSRGRSESSMSKVLGCDVSDSQMRLCLAHLKQCVDFVSERRFKTVVGVENVLK